MTITELKDIAKSYGLIIYSDSIEDDVYFPENDKFWDNITYTAPNKLFFVRTFCGCESTITVYNTLIRTKNGYTINRQKTYPLPVYTPKRLHNLIKRIQKQIKVELIAKRLEGIKQDF
jgi:hypothetical protein